MTYPELLEFCGSEGQAALLAEKFDYKNMAESELLIGVVKMMCSRSSNPPPRRHR